jgi:hypothetical protein
MVQEIQNYQLKWMNYVLRMPANRLIRKLLKYKPHAGRDFGRPYHRWTDQFLESQIGQWYPNCQWEEEEEKEEEVTRSYRAMRSLFHF